MWIRATLPPAPLPVSLDVIRAGQEALWEKQQGEIRRQVLLDKIAELKRQAPRLLIEAVVGPKIFSEGHDDGTLARAYHLVVVRFKNEPEERTDSSIARGVTARIDVLRNDDSIAAEATGQWVDESKSVSADDEGPLVTVKQIDIAPGFITAKLPVILDIRYPTNQGWFLFAAPQYVGNAKYAVPGGEYRIRIRLSSANVREADATFWLSLAVGNGGLPSVAEIKQDAR